MRICTESTDGGTAGHVGIGLVNPSERLQVNGKIKCEDVKYQITDAGGAVSDQSLVSLHSSVATLATNITSCVTTTALDTALDDYALVSALPTTTSTVTSGSDALITSDGV